MREMYAVGPKLENVHYNWLTTTWVLSIRVCKTSSSSRSYHQ